VLIWKQSVWIGGVEVWRTCTAEPTLAGIHFTYSKDITAFASLLNTPQPIVVDIGNYITGPYNGSFNATLSITFFNISTSLRRREHAADEILSISKVGQDVPNSLYSLPDDAAAVFLSIPTNTTRIVLDILASGNANEEFWYTNVPDQFVDTFQNWNISLLGQGTFREVIVYLDGNPVAAAWPFEIMFTGGISPFFWKPIVDYRTFDLPSYRLDLTSFLPLLRNGTHQIRLDVLGQPSTLENWYITGQIHLWYSNGGPSDLSMQTNDYTISPSANITVTAEVAADNTSLMIHTSASRQNQLYTVEYNNIQSNVVSGNGSNFLQNITQTTFFDSPLASGHFIFDLNVVEIDHPNGSSVLQVTLNQTFHRVAPNALTGLFEVEHAEVAGTSWLLVKDSELIKGKGDTSVSLDFLSPHRLYFRNVRAIELQIAYDYELDNSIGFVQEAAE